MTFGCGYEIFLLDNERIVLLTITVFPPSNTLKNWIILCLRESVQYVNEKCV